MFILPIFTNLIKCTDLYNYYKSIKEKDSKYYSIENGNKGIEFLNYNYNVDMEEHKKYNVSTFFLPQIMKSIFVEEVNFYDMFVIPKLLALGTSEFGVTEFMLVKESKLNNEETSDITLEREFLLKQDFINTILDESMQESIKSFDKDKAKEAVEILKDYYIYHNGLQIDRLHKAFLTQIDGRSRPSGLYKIIENDLYIGDKVQEINSNNSQFVSSNNVYLQEIIVKIENNISEKSRKIFEDNIKKINELSDFKLKEKIGNVENLLKEAFKNYKFNFEKGFLQRKNYFNFCCDTFKDYYIAWRELIKYAQNLEYFAVKK